MPKFNSKRLFLSCLGLMIMMGQNAYAQSIFSSNNYYLNSYPDSQPGYAQMASQNRMAMQKSTMQGQRLEQNLQILLNEHGLLLNQAILAALNNAPPAMIEAGKARLLKNSSNIAYLLSSIYGVQAGEIFENLFNQHILLGSQYINAVKMNNMNLADQISNQAIANGRSLAEFFSRLSPTIPYAIWQQMFDQHVMIEAAQTRAYFTGNIAKANQLRDASLMQLKELADIIAYAISKQSPQAGPYQAIP
jgi:hypothetical protein